MNVINEEVTWRKLEYLFRQIDFFLEQKTRRYLVSKGLTHPRFVLLAEVYLNPGLSLTELQAKIGATLGTLSTLTDQLVIDGLLTRERRLDDRRVIELNLTQKGQILLEDVLKYRYGQIINILEKMSTESAHSLIRIMEEFVSHI